MNKIEKAYELMQDHEYDLALHKLREALEQATDDEKLTIAQVYQQWGFYEQAENILIELNKKYPKESEIILILAQIYIDQESDERALDLLLDVKKDDSNYVQALIQLADLYQAQGLNEVAETKLIEAKQLAPDEMIIDFALGELLFSMGIYNRSITFYERVLDESKEINEVSIALRLAEAYAGDGQYEKSLVLYNSIDDEQPDTLFKHGLTAYYAKEQQIAIQQWERLLNQDKFYHVAYIYLAKVYKEQGELTKALEIATDGLHIDAYNKELYFLTGKLAYELGNVQEGIDHIQETIALDPEYKEAVLFLVNYYQENGSDELTVELLTDLKQMGVNEPLYDWELAKSYVQLEYYDKALRLYEEVYPLLQHDEQFLQEYAYFLVEEGKIDDAVIIFEKYLTIVPDDFETDSFVKRLLGQE